MFLINSLALGSNYIMTSTSWAIAIVILLVIVLLSTIVLFVFRKRLGQRRGAFGTQLSDCSLDKSISTLYSQESSTNPTIKPIIPYNLSAKNEANKILKSTIILIQNFIIESKTKGWLYVNQVFFIGSVE